MFALAQSGSSISGGCFTKSPGGLFLLYLRKRRVDAITGLQKNNSQFDFFFSCILCVFSFFLTSVFLFSSKYRNKSSILCRSHLIPGSRPSAAPGSPSAPPFPYSRPPSLSSTSLRLRLIANAGSIAAAIDLCAETPSRQEK